MMNSKKSVVKPGLKNLTVYVLIGVEIRKKVNFVVSMKVKTHRMNAFPKVKLFSFLNVVSKSKQ